MAVTTNKLPVSGKAAREVFQDISTNVVATAGADPSTTLVTGKTAHTVFLQKISVHVTTAAAQTWTVDDNTTGRIAAVLPASAAVGAEHVLLDNEDGFPMNEGESVDLVASAAGVAGVLHVVGFLAPTGVMTAAQQATNT